MVGAAVLASQSFFSYRQENRYVTAFESQLIDWSLITWVMQHVMRRGKFIGAKLQPLGSTISHTRPDK
jgi:hypothetical protein